MSRSPTQGSLSSPCESLLALETEQVAQIAQAFAQMAAQMVQALLLMMLRVCCGGYRRQLERANAEEEQAAAEALKQVHAEQQRDHDTNFNLHLQAEEIKVRMMPPLPSPGLFMLFHHVKLLIPAAWDK